MVLPSFSWDNYKDYTYVGTSNGLRRGQPATYRDHIKTHNSQHLGAHFGHKTYQKYWGLMPVKTVLVVILALLIRRAKITTKTVLTGIKPQYFW